MDATLTQEQDLFECFGIPPHVWELPPEAPLEERVPHASRRNWVYREMAFSANAMLGVESLPWLQEPADSPSNVSAQNVTSLIRKQSSSK